MEFPVSCTFVFFYFAWISSLFHPQMLVQFSAYAEEGKYSFALSSPHRSLEYAHVKRRERRRGRGRREKGVSRSGSREGPPLLEWKIKFRRSPPPPSSFTLCAKKAFFRAMISFSSPSSLFDALNIGFGWEGNST